MNLISEPRVITKVCKIEGPAQKEVQIATIPTCTVQSPSQEQKSSVPEVYVRPPTPTPSTANLPIITVSSPSRRSSMASRRGSDTSAKSSRRNSECSVRFVNEENMSSMTECKRLTEGSPRPLPRMREEFERNRSPESPRRYSENITPTGSTRELRRCSDFTHEKNRGSQFATKLRRNSDFGNRTPRRMLPPDEHRLPKVLDLSPAGKKKNMAHINKQIFKKHSSLRSLGILFFMGTFYLVLISFNNFRFKTQFRYWYFYGNPQIRLA